MHSVKQDHFAILIIMHKLTANKLRCIVSHADEWGFSWEMLYNFLKEIYTNLCLKINK